MDRLENAYRMIPIDRLKINTFRLLNKINEYDNKNNNIVQVSDKNNIEFKKQLKQASLMINVIEERLAIMGEKATPGEKFAFENDIRDLKSKLQGNGAKLLPMTENYFVMRFLNKLIMGM